MRNHLTHTLRTSFCLLPSFTHAVAKEMCRPIFDRSKIIYIKLPQHSIRSLPLNKQHAAPLRIRLALSNQSLHASKQMFRVSFNNELNISLLTNFNKHLSQNRLCKRMKMYFWLLKQNRTTCGNEVGQRQHRQNLRNSNTYIS